MVGTYIIWKQYRPINQAQRWQNKMLLKIISYLLGLTISQKDCEVFRKRICQKQLTFNLFAYFYIVPIYNTIIVCTLYSKV